MARISYETVQETANSYDGGDKVEFFSLKNHGDEAIVRIMHDSVADFDIMTTHPVKLGNFWRKVNCIRDPREPMDNCPLCKSGLKIQQRFFIHMIQYIKDPATNQITAKPVVWERAANEYATKFKTLIDEYGPLSNCIFKIRRNGQPQSMDTTYEIMFGNPSIYPDQLYPKNPEAFNGYTALGRVVMDKSAEEMMTYLSTGNFPAKQNTTTTNGAPVQSNAGDNTVVTTPPPVYTPPVAPPTGIPAYEAAPAPNPAEVPWSTGAVPGTSAPATTAAPARPTRYY